MPDNDSVFDPARLLSPIMSHQLEAAFFLVWEKLLALPRCVILVFHTFNVSLVAPIVSSWW